VIDVHGASGNSKQAFRVIIKHVCDTMLVRQRSFAVPTTSVFAEVGLSLQVHSQCLKSQPTEELERPDLMPFFCDA
jgi:hypothetical protein